MAQRNNHHTKIKVGITLGDIGGIGPELVLKTFDDARMMDLIVPILYGSSKVINIHRKMLDIERFNYAVISAPREAKYNRFNIIDCMPDIDRVEIGQPTEVGGKAALIALDRAIKDGMHEDIDALVTLPVDKASIQQHAENFRGHTEMLAEAFGSDEQLMLMVSEDLRVGMVTNHVSVANITRNISQSSVVRKAEILDLTLKRDFNIQRPLIAVLGLNPHAGDQGLIGMEENEIIRPAIQQLRAKGILAEGPYPADGLFGSLAYRKFHGILAMYHDQGLIPFKLIAGFRGVNFTAGIPFVRTSPDHGVAYDIVGKNVADPESLQQAIFCAIDIFRHRRENQTLIENAMKPQKIERPAQDDEVPELDEEENVI